MRIQAVLLVCCSLFAFIHAPVSAQSNWAKTFGGGNNEEARDVQPTSDGGYIVAGGTASFGSGGEDAWILKLDSAGNVEFEKVYGGAGDDVATSIQQTTDGGYIVAGRTASFGAGGTDFWVLKLDSSGSIQFQKAYGGPSGDSAFSVRQTSDGGFVVAGQTNSFGAGNGDFWVLKLDSSGTIQFQKTFGGANTDLAFCVRQTSDNGYVVSGRENGLGALADNFWILKLDSSGAIQFQKSFGGPSTDQGFCAEQTSDGGYIFVGQTLSFGAGDFDAWVLKLDATGAIQFQKAYGGATADGVRFVHQTPDGGYVISSNTQSFGAGSIDFWLLKLDAAGNIQFEKAYGGIQTDTIPAVQPAPDGGYVMAGNTGSFGAGLNDAWVLKVGADGSIGSSCSLVSDTTATVNNTAATVVTTAVVAADTTATVTTTSVTPTTIFSTTAEQCSCPQITVSPASLPDGTAGAAYSQTITASGGAGAVTFSILSGSLPAGLSLSPAGLLSGIPGAGGSFDFTVLATDADGCSGSKAYTLNIAAVSCLFCDDFEDGVLATDWQIVKPAWTETGGAVIGTPAGRKAVTIATPAFAGCAICSVEATMASAGGTGNLVWLLSWFVDKKNDVELMMKQESGKWILKERFNGKIVAKAKGISAILPNIFYRANVTFDGSQFVVTVDGVELMRLTPVAPVPSGTVGFEVKNTSASFGEISVN